MMNEFCYCSTHDHSVVLKADEGRCALRRIEELESLIDRMVKWDDLDSCFDRDYDPTPCSILDDMRKAREER